jgi:hypothetical protein
MEKSLVSFCWLLPRSLFVTITVLRREMETLFFNESFHMLSHSVNGLSAWHISGGDTNAWQPQGF